MGAKESTVARRVKCSGVGLHDGSDVEIALCPAAPGSGIVFAVASGSGIESLHNFPGHSVEIPVRAGAVVSSSRATTLTDGRGVRLSTVEHLLATLYVLRLDNVRIEVQGSEIPMLDGSALPFVDWARSAGRVLQTLPRREFAVARPFEIRDGERSIRIDPYPSLRISYAIDFDHPAIGRQQLELPTVDEASFTREVAAARTFGFEHEIESLRAAGLAIGGSLENALVLDDEHVLNESGLRWPDEFVRHKVIDLLGDLSLLGGWVNGHIRVERGGHSLHHRLVEGLLESHDLLMPVVDQHESKLLGRNESLQSLA